MSPQIENLHFILFPLMSHSHIIPITDFAKLLARHGVFVSIITTPLDAIRYNATIQSAQAQNLKIQMIPIKFPSLKAGLPDGCENIDAIDSLHESSMINFFRACQMLQGPLETLLQQLCPKPSCIVSTNAIPWTQNVAQKFNIPRYNFETVSCFTLFCSHKLSQSVDVVGSDDTQSFRVPNICHDIQFTNAQLPNASKNDSDGFEDVIDQINRARDSVRGTLVNSFQELEPWYLDNIKDVVGNVWSVGPVSLCNRENSEKSNRGDEAAVDEHYCATWLDSMKPNSVIYACFGSLCRISTPQTKEIGLGLEKSGFPFVWIIRKQDCSKEVEAWLAEEKFEERVKGRGLVIRGWAPQVLILSHPSIGGFLTHCGWNSTLEGICVGVPMITWPMFAEQFYNEKFVVGVLGVGVRVGVEGCMNSEVFVKWEKLKLAFEKVMDESDEDVKEMRKKAKEIAKAAGNAVEKGGSSYMNITSLIQDVIKFSCSD